MTQFPRNGFLDIGVPNPFQDSEIDGVARLWKSIGWISLRDAKGRLAIWLKEAERD